MNLIYINYIGSNSEGEYEYEFLFSDNPDTVWGEDWAEQVPSSCGNIPPDPTTYNKVLKVTIPFELELVQLNSCFSLQDCIDGIVMLFWFFTENGYVGLPFGTEFDEVKDFFNEYGVEIEDNYD